MKIKKAVPVLLLLALAAVFLLLGFLNTEETEVQFTESVTVADAEEEQEEEKTYQWELDSETEGVINALVIGKDIDEEGTSRSDSLIIVSLNTVSHGITMVSLLRDTYVDIPGHHSQKLNAAYSMGGVELLEETLALNFDFVPDYYVEIDYDAFEVIIDTLGGIDIEITEEEAEYLRGYGGNLRNGKVGYYTGGRTYEAEAGVSCMYGQEALDYCRARHVGNSDFERTLRQRKMVEAIFEKVQGEGLVTMFELVENAVPFVETDLTLSQIISTGANLIQMDSWNLNGYRIPADGMYTEETIEKYGSVLRMSDPEAVKTLLRSYLYSADGGKAAYQAMTEQYGQQETE